MRFWVQQSNWDEERRRGADAAFKRLLADIRREELEALEDNAVYLDTYVLLPEQPEYEPKRKRKARAWQQLQAGGRGP